MRQSPEIEREKRRVIDFVTEDKQNRDQVSDLFRGVNLEEYTRASLMQFVGHRAKPSWKRDYQYNIFEPITRDKVIAISSKAGALFEAQFLNTNKMLGGKSKILSTVLGAFYEDSRYNLNDVERSREIRLDALIAPKAIWYEGWRHQMRTIRDIEDRDPNGQPVVGKAKRIVHYNGPWGQGVPVEEIIPGSLKIRDLQEQPRFTWRTKMNIGEFRRKFSIRRFPAAAMVRTHEQLIEDGLTEMLVCPTDLAMNEVEVIYAFEKWDDRLSTIASGVQLTPINSPMPFAHKDYPFAWAGFEMLKSNFIYDMPLPIKILDMQDMNNEIFNLTLDLVWRALNEVILVKDGDGINDDVIYGGGMIPVDDPKNFQKLEFGSSFGFQAAGNMMDRMRRSIESSSLDAPASGQTGTRQITAREAVIAREAALEISSLFVQNLESMEQQKALLRVQNQLDRYSRPVEWTAAIGEDLTGKAIPVFREITADDTRLENGKRGRVTVAIRETPRTEKELNAANDEDTSVMSQTIDIAPAVIRAIKPKVRIVANSSVKKSKALETAEARAFFIDAMGAPQVFNVEEAAKDYVEKLGKDPDQALAPKQDAAQDPMAAMMAKMSGKGGAPGEAKMPKDAMDDPINEAL
jgi:hypothetical protein